MAEVVIELVHKLAMVTLLQPELIKLIPELGPGLLTAPEI